MANPFDRSFETPVRARAESMKQVAVPQASDKWLNRGVAPLSAESPGLLKRLCVPHPEQDLPFFRVNVATSIVLSIAGFAPEPLIMLP
jgi:hypothetical protein